MKQVTCRLGYTPCLLTCAFNLETRHLRKSHAVGKRTADQTWPKVQVKTRDVLWYLRAAPCAQGPCSPACVRSRIVCASFFDKAWESTTNRPAKAWSNEAGPMIMAFVLKLLLSLSLPLLLLLLLLSSLSAVVCCRCRCRCRCRCCWLLLLLVVGCCLLVVGCWFCLWLWLLLLLLVS